MQVSAFADLDLATSYGLWQLRSEVFVVEQQCAYLDLDGRDTESATRHLWVEEAGVPIAYLRVLDDGDAVRVGRVVVGGSSRGRGLGELLMARAHRLTAGRPVVLDAQSYLADWYARLGYRVTGPEFLDDGIPHLPMLRP